MLVDNITLTIVAGNGGNGSAHFRRDARTSRGGPDGGNGGNGGDIYFIGSHNITDLREFRYKKEIVAQNGVDGMGDNKFGRNGSNITIEIPLGTRITELKSGRVYEITDSKYPMLFGRGGQAGRGNTEFKTATNQAPTNFEKGTPGEKKELLLELRLIAEVGLIGLPNAGKSSILRMLTHATPKIGAYPFTTLEPNIGMLGAHTIADIPGLIKGASKGKGLGVDFLRHIQKTKILIHCIDLTNSAPRKTYDIVRTEFEKFDPILLTKPEYILLTKTDLVTPAVITKTKNFFTKLGKNVLTCSIYDPESIDALKKTLIKLLEV
jgi:GTP-binding protein